MTSGTELASPEAELPDRIETRQGSGIRWFIGGTGALLAAAGAWATAMLASQPFQDGAWELALGPLVGPLGALMLVGAARLRNGIVLDREGFTAMRMGLTRRVLWRDVERLELFFVKFWSGVAWKTRDGRSGGTPVGLDLPAEQLLGRMERYRRRAVAGKAALEGR